MLFLCLGFSGLLSVNIILLIAGVILILFLVNSITSLSLIIYIFLLALINIYSRIYENAKINRLKDRSKEKIKKTKKFRKKQDDRMLNIKGFIHVGLITATFFSITPYLMPYHKSMFWILSLVANLFMLVWCIELVSLVWRVLKLQKKIENI